MKISQIVDITAVECLSTKDIEVKRVISCKKKAQTGDLIFFAEEINLPENSKPSVIITTKELADKYQNKTDIILTTKNPKLAFAKISKKIKIDKVSKSIAKNVKIGKNTVICENVQIGKNSIIDENCTIYDGVIIGDNVRIFAGCVIGADGFGTAIDKETKKHTDIKHLGKVKIGNNVTIGANTTIDKATLNNESTIIADGVKIDNLVHIAHNTTIDENTAIAAKTGISGSVKIGKNCLIGGMVGIFQSVIITDNVTLIPAHRIHKDILDSGIYAGNRPIIKRKK